MAFEIVQIWHAAQPRVAQSRLKRLIDVGGAMGLILFFAPALVVVAMCVAFDSPGPVLFRQRRGGLNGTPFVILKFRTMTVMEDGADVVQATLHDPRVTKIGRFLRRTSLDELPQLFNVLRGDMSLVGPRPHALAHDANFAKVVANYGERHQVRPGITGLAQVSGMRGEIGSGWQIERRVAKDLQYIQSWTVGLDVRILLLTAVGLFQD